MSRTRGGRVSQRGFVMFYVGFAGIFIGGLIVGGFDSAVAAWIVLGLTFGLAFAGLGVVLAGKRIDDRNLAEYQRKVAAGELPKWKPGDPNPLG